MAGRPADSRFAPAMAGRPADVEALAGKPAESFLGFLKVQPAELRGWVLLFSLMMVVAIFWAFLPPPWLSLRVAPVMIRCGLC